MLDQVVDQRLHVRLQDRRLPQQDVPLINAVEALALLVKLMVILYTIRDVAPLFQESLVVQIQG